MAWNPKGGPWGSGGGGGGGPWGGGGPSAPQPPDVEEMIRRTQDRFKRFMPGNFGGGRGIALLIAGIVGVWLVFGFYRVQPGEEGIALLFGQYVKIAAPGLNYWFPPPIGDVIITDTQKTNQITIGFRGTTEQTRGTGTRDVPQESLMLTSDENIIDVDFVVQWRIKDVAAYQFNIRDPEQTVQVAAESAIREIMGQTPLQDALTIRRQEVDQRTRDLLQNILDSYNSGIAIVDVKSLKVDPPGDVIDAFNDVQRARQDRERAVNEAQAYRNDIVPRAKGQADVVVQEATGYREKMIREADGEAQRFSSVFEAYKLGPDVTTRRLYLERMQEVLGNTQKVIIDNKGTGQGVVPYLPLPELKKSVAEGTQ